MRICYIAEASSVHTQDWVNFFARKGHEVHLISTTGWWEFLFGDNYHDIVNFHLLRTTLTWLPFVSRYINMLGWIIQTRRLIKRIKPDLIDAHYITVYGYLAVATGFHPLTLTAWGSDILIDAKQNWLHRLLTKYALKKAEQVICDSETVKTELLELGTNPEKINIIYNGVDTKKFCPLREVKDGKDTVADSQIKPPEYQGAYPRGHRSMHSAVGRRI